MRKVKVGPAFSDSVSFGTVKRRRERNGLLTQEILSLLPLICLILVAGFFAVRLFILQVMRSDYYRRLSDDNRMRTTVIPAPRGIIFDRNNKPLVNNTPAFKILEGKKVKWLGKDEALERIANGKTVYNDVQRAYLYPDVFAHVLGYVGQISEDELSMPEYQRYDLTDFVGKMGLEAEYEHMLHGTNGRELYEVDAAGNKVRFLGKDQPMAGQNLYTTLDIEIQKSVAEAMKEASKGAVVVSDPRNGGILAIYSKPTFDPNLFTHSKTYQPVGDYKNVTSILLDGTAQPLLDRAIGGVYPPGSTFKLVTAISGLEEKAITKDTIIEDTGVLKLGAFSFANWYYTSYGKTEGPVDVVKAIKRSNDIFFYKAAELTGIDKIHDWAQKFGLGKQLGIDLPGELAGTVPNKAWKKKMLNEPWYTGDNYNLGIGQGYLLATPLQVNMFTVPFANEGVLYRPHLMRDKTYVLRKDFLDKAYVDLVREGMRESCAPTGVAWPFFDFKVKNDHLPLDGRDYIEEASGSAVMTRVSVGCKTGTAETGDEHTLPHSWITVFAPFYKPEIVVTVLVENGGEGSNVAGPIAKKILTDYFEGKK